MDSQKVAPGVAMHALLSDCLERATNNVFFFSFFFPKYLSGGPDILIGPDSHKFLRVRVGDPGQEASKDQWKDIKRRLTRPLSCYLETHH